MIAARLAIATLLALALTGCWALWQRGNAALARVDAITSTANTTAAELKTQRQQARDNANAAGHLAGQSRYVSNLLIINGFLSCAIMRVKKMSRKINLLCR